MSGGKLLSKKMNARTYTSTHWHIGKLIVKSGSKKKWYILIIFEITLSKKYFTFLYNAENIWDTDLFIFYA